MFKLWLYLTRLIGPVALLLAVALAFLMPPSERVVLGWGIVIVVFAVGVLGGVFGLLMVTDRLRWNCPFCNRKSPVGGDKVRGMWLQCESCGLVHGRGRFGLRLVRESDREAPGREHAPRRAEIACVPRRNAASVMSPGRQPRVQVAHHSYLLPSSEH